MFSAHKVYFLSSVEHCLEHVVYKATWTPHVVRALFVKVYHFVYIFVENHFDEWLFANIKSHNYWITTTKNHFSIESNTHTKFFRLTDHKRLGRF